MTNVPGDTLKRYLLAACMALAAGTTLVGDAKELADGVFYPLD